MKFYLNYNKIFDSFSSSLSSIILFIYYYIFNFNIAGLILSFNAFSSETPFYITYLSIYTINKSPDVVLTNKY